MLGRWGSTFVALILIVIFYGLRRYYRQRSSVLKKEIIMLKKKIPSQKGIPSKAMHRSRTAGKAVPISSKPLHVKKKRIQSKAAHDRPASLLLHPQSLEKGKNEYMTCAPFFQGLYERTYQGVQGNICSPAPAELIRNWETRILATHSEHLSLVWMSIVQRHLGRRFYHSGNTHLHPAQNPDQEKALLEAWLKQLREWGLQRSSEPGPACWVLGQHILEQDPQEKQKSY